MYSKIYWLPNDATDGKVGIMARPRGNDWLDAEVAYLKQRGVSVLVSLLQSDEISELELSKEWEYCMQHEIEFINFPIPDRGLPPQNKLLEKFLDHLKERLHSGHSIVIHCRMGIGRSSIIAGALLLVEGKHAEEIFKAISAVRGLKVPDTDEQIAWLKDQEY
jgi:protein-tyrosine phosphatase